MENKEVAKLFADSFKFAINQDVRHKGDNKHGHSNDLGLLVLKRQIEETEDDNGNVYYKRQYVCRMIRFSGSGDLALFKEAELMSVSEYNERVIKEEEEREEMRNNAHFTNKAIFGFFGVHRDTHVYLKSPDGTVDKTEEYRVTGFSSTKEGDMSESIGKYVLILRCDRPRGETLMSSGKEARVSSKDEFVRVQDVKEGENKEPDKLV